VPPWPGPWGAQPAGRQHRAGTVWIRLSAPGVRDREREDQGAFYIFAIITDGKHSKTTLRIAPTYLPLLFETTFKYILFADVARQRVHFF
jgi:hypothetical protein